jgi:hypothetical protein
MKLCACCKILKCFDDFHKAKHRKDGFQSYCKECRKTAHNSNKNKARKHEWYLKNKDLTIERSKRRIITDKDAIKGYKIKYYSNNKEKVKSKSATRYKIIKDTPEFKEQRRIRNIKWRSENKHIVTWRSLLKTVLKKIDRNKTDKTIRMLGYSAEEFRNYIESLWLPGMSWQNHGEWHIDHIKPIYTYDKTTDVKIINALSNLRPLWATTRTIDGITYEGNLNRNHTY